MPKHDDPAADRAAMRAEAQREQQLDAILDQIADAEKARTLASATITKLWSKVRADGFCESDARRRHVQRLTRN